MEVNLFTWQVMLTVILTKSLLIFFLSSTFSVPCCTRWSMQHCLALEKIRVWVEHLIIFFSGEGWYRFCLYTWEKDRIKKRGIIQYSKFFTSYPIFIHNPRWRICSILVQLLNRNQKVRSFNLYIKRNFLKAISVIIEFIGLIKSQLKIPGSSA